MTTDFDSELFKQEVMNEVNKALSGLAARIERETEKKFNLLQEAPKEKDKTSPELLALQTQLEKLQKERELEKQQLAKAEKDSYLTSVVSKFNALTPALLKTVLDSSFGENLKKDEANSKWYYVSGESSQDFEQVVDDFLKGDGAIFLPPTTKVNGSGTEAGNSNPEKTTKTQPTSLSELIETKLKGK